MLRHVHPVDHEDFDVQALERGCGADGGYAGAGCGVLTPVAQRTDGIPLHADQRTFNRLLRGLRCLGERGFALLVGRWKILRHVKISPSRITDLARAALVLTQFEHKMIA